MSIHFISSYMNRGNREEKEIKISPPKILLHLKISHLGINQTNINLRTLISWFEKFNFLAQRYQNLHNSIQIHYWSIELYAPKLE
jgi:hypothetical protein